MRLQIELRLRAAVGFDSDAGVWVSWCPALDIYSQGTYQREAAKALEEALVLYLKHCYRRKILDDILTERGFYDVEPSNIHDDDEIIAVREVGGQQFTHTFDVTVGLPLRQQQQNCVAP